MPICRLLYTSQALNPDDGVPIAPIRALAARSGERNHRDKITGCLAYVDGSFIQILEGPTPAVEATFERICRDFRHKNVKLADLARSEERIFGQWGMAFITDEEVRMQGPLEEIRFMAGVNAGETVNLMRKLLRN